VECLETSQEGEELRRLHAEYYLALAEATEPDLRQPEQAAFYERLETDYDNLRVALKWTLGNGAVDVGLRLSEALLGFWRARGYWTEARENLSRAITQSSVMGRSVSRANIIRGAAELAWLQYDFEQAHALFNESLEIYRESGDWLHVARTLTDQGFLAIQQGDNVAARTLLEESLIIQREVGDKVGIVKTLNVLGHSALSEGDYATARSFFEDSLAFARESGEDTRTAAVLNNLGEAARLQGDYHTARSKYVEGLAIFRANKDKNNIANMLANLGYVAQHQEAYGEAREMFQESLELKWELNDVLGTALALAGLAGDRSAAHQPERAARLLGAATAPLEARGLHFSLADRMEYDLIMDSTRAQLDEATFEAAWAEGYGMGLEQAIAMALEPV
jgi:tetratricopeptide (TPR) repeat protein